MVSAGRTAVKAVSAAVPAVTAVKDAAGIVVEYSRRWWKWPRGAGRPAGEAIVSPADAYHDDADGLDEGDAALGEEPTSRGEVPAAHGGCAPGSDVDGSSNAAPCAPPLKEFSRITTEAEERSNDVQGSGEQAQAAEPGTTCLKSKENVISLLVADGDGSGHGDDDGDYGDGGHCDDDNVDEDGGVGAGEIVPPLSKSHDVFSFLDPSSALDQEPSCSAPSSSERISVPDPISGSSSAGPPPDYIVKERQNPCSSDPTHFVSDRKEVTQSKPLV